MQVNYDQEQLLVKMINLTIERELLSIAETLKEVRNALLEQQLKVYTDYKNLTYKRFNIERVMQCRLITEEYSPELIIAADVLTR